MTSSTNILRRISRRARAAILAALLAALLHPVAATADPYLGTWTPNEPYGGSVAGADALERATGRRVAIVNWYQNWGGNSWITSVQSQAVRAVTDSGRVPLLTWEPRDPQLGPEQPAFALARIVDGTHDAYVASFARSLRDLGSLIYLRPMHEMNGTWYPWGAGVNSNSAAQFVAAWQRIHRIFAAEGATNVRWVWSPNNFDVSPAYPMEAFYPGAPHVDVLAADGYNWGSARPQFGGWRSFQEVFRSVYERLKALGPQPIWFAEVGSAPDGGDKAAWIRDMFGRARTMDRLQAIVWFNEFKELDWRADADPAVAAAFTPLAPGTPYPLVFDSYDEAALAGTSAAFAAADAPGATAAGGGTTTPKSPRATSGSRSAAGGGGTAGDSGGVVEDATSASSGDRARGLLRVYAKKRVAAGRRTVVRWRAKPMPHVRRWVVYLDGRRVHSVTARGGRTHRLGRRVNAVGRHRWRVVGRDARGRRAISAVRSFRVVRGR